MTVLFIINKSIIYVTSTENEMKIRIWSNIKYTTQSVVHITGPNVISSVPVYVLADDDAKSIEDTLWTTKFTFTFRNIKAFKITKAIRWEYLRPSTVTMYIDIHVNITVHRFPVWCCAADYPQQEPRSVGGIHPCHTNGIRWEAEQLAQFEVSSLRQESTIVISFSGDTHKQCNLMCIS